MRTPTPAAPGPAADVTAQPILSDRQIIARWAFALATAMVCGGLAAAAALVPAPPGVIPMVAVICVTMPMLAGWQLPPLPHLLRRRRRRAVVAQFQRQLEALPEAPHPLDH